MHHLPILRAASSLHLRKIGFSTRAYPFVKTTILASPAPELPDGLIDEPLVVKYGGHPDQLSSVDLGT